jgi:hypothetical protein
MANILNLEEIYNAKWLDILNTEPDKQISLEGNFSKNVNFRDAKF